MGTWARPANKGTVNPMVRQPVRAFETVAAGKFLSVDRAVDADPQMYQAAVEASLSM
jgi:hypothetical protein